MLGGTWHTTKLDEYAGISNTVTIDYKFNNKTVNKSINRKEYGYSSYKVIGGDLRVTSKKKWSSKFNYFSERLAFSSSNNEVRLWTTKDISKNGSINPLKLKTNSFLHKSMNMYKYAKNSVRSFDYWGIEFTSKSHAHIRTGRASYSARWKIDSVESGKLSYNVLSITPAKGLDPLSLMMVDRVDGTYLASDLMDNGVYAFLTNNNNVINALSSEVVSF